MRELGRRLLVTLAVGAVALATTATAMATVAGTPQDDAYEVNEDTSLVVPAAGVLDNDSVASGTACVVSLPVSGQEPTWGTIDAWAADGSFTYTPIADWNSPASASDDEFQYELGYTDPSCVSASANGTVTITVNPVNDPPTAVLVLTCGGGVTVAEDSGAFTDPAHCTELHSWGPVDEITQELLEWVVTSDHPELFSVAPSISIVDTTFGELQFTPAPNAHGSATVTVRGRDSGGTERGGDDLSPALQFTITITSVNDAPVAVGDAFFALKDSTLNIAAPGVLSNDSDVDNDPLSAVQVTAPAHGILTLAANGSFSYTPAAGYTGPDAFSYRASDGSLQSPIRVVSLTVTALPPSPTPIPPPTATPEIPTEEPSPEATPEETVEASEPIGPTPSGLPSTAATAGPQATVAPTAAPGDSAGSGGLSLPILLVLVLLAVLLGFAAAVYVPKWLEAQRTGRPPPEL